jgi:hypothetical protein
LTREDENTFFVYSDEFIFSAEELEKSNNPGKVATVSYYLYGHSLELVYKSYLYKNEIELKELKKIGHNLELALEKCIELGFGKHIEIDYGYKKVIREINKYYYSKELEYMSRTDKTFPILFDVRDIAKKTLNTVFSAISAENI